MQNFIQIIMAQSDLIGSQLGEPRVVLQSVYYRYQISKKPRSKKTTPEPKTKLTFDPNTQNPSSLIPGCLRKNKCYQYPMPPPPYKSFRDSHSNKRIEWKTPRKAPPLFCCWLSPPNLSIVAIECLESPQSNPKKS